MREPVVICEERGDDRCQNVYLCLKFKIFGPLGMPDWHTTFNKI